MKLTNVVVILLAIMFFSLSAIAQETHLNGFGGITILNPSGTMIFDTDIMQSNDISSDNLFIAYDMSSMTIDREIYDFSPQGNHGNMTPNDAYWVIAEDGTSNPMGNSYPTAQYYNDRTYVVWQGDSHDPYISYYNHTSSTWESPVQVATNPLTSDAHGYPAIMIDWSGYIHVFYGSHASAQKHAKSDNPEDISAWSVQADVDTWASYPSMVQIDYTFYIFYRGGSMTNRPLNYRSSTDNMTTWSAERIIINYAGSPDAWINSRQQHPVSSIDNIHITWNYYDDDINDYALTTYHAYLNTTDDNMYSQDGIDLGATIDKTEADNNALINTAEVRGGDGVVNLDSSDNPYVIMWTSETATGNINFTYWDGGAWSSIEAIFTTSIAGVRFPGNFIILSSTSIEAFLNRYGNIEEWSWDGVDWTMERTVFFNTTYGIDFGNPFFPLNSQAPIKLVFGERDIADLINSDLRVFAGAAFLTPSISLIDAYFGQARDFDGFDDTISANISITPTTSLTWGVWFEHTRIDQEEYLIELGNWGDEGSALISIDTSNYANCGFWESTAIQIQSNAIIPLNELTSIICRWNGTLATIWINGEMQTDNTTSFSGPINVNNITISPTSVIFNGPVDEVIGFFDAKSDLETEHLGKIQSQLTIGGGSTSVPRRYSGLILALPWLIVAGIIFTMFYIAFLAWRKSLKGEW